MGLTQRSKIFMYIGSAVSAPPCKLQSYKKNPKSRNPAKIRLPPLPNRALGIKKSSYRNEKSLLPLKIAKGFGYGLYHALFKNITDNFVNFTECNYTICYRKTKTYSADNIYITP